MTTELVKYDAACHAIAEARTVDEVKDVRDRAVAIQAYARQAKNRQMEIDAAEIRIRAERRLGEMLAETPKNTGTRTEGGGTGAGGTVSEPPATPTLADMGIDKKLSARSQKIAAVPKAEFEGKLADWRDRAESDSDRVSADILTPKTAHVSHNSGENEWYTPTEYIDAVIKVMGDIDCDPASTEVANRIVGAKVFFTAEQDGLQQKWGERVYMNPPYSTLLVAQFAESLVSRIGSGEVQQAVVLVNNATDTVWFHRMMEIAASICLVRKRVRFISPKGKAGSPLQGQVFLYFGKYIGDFHSAFKQFGAICNVIR